MVSKKGVAMVVAAALLLSIGGLCVKMIPWQPLSINSFGALSRWEFCWCLPG